MALIFLLLSNLFFGQTSSPINLSPDGVFENVYDQQGNLYKLSDLIIDNGSSTSKSVLVTCSTTSYFNLYFEPGCGMDSATDLDQIARRNVICKVFEDISNFINSPLTTTGNKVNIWVRNIANISGSSGALGVATAFNVIPNVINNVGGIIDNEVWKTIHTGVDSYANIVNPLVPNSPSTNTPSMFYHGMMAFNFTGTTVWNTNLGIVTPATNVDLYSIALHEITHALGFASAINQNGTSKFGTKNYYNRYDTFLKNSSGNQFLISNTGTCNPMYNNTFTLNSTILQPANALPNTPVDDSTNCNNAIKFVGSSYTVPVYTPNVYSSSSSLSHFEDMCYINTATSLPYGNNIYFVMSNANSAGITKRYLKKEERAAICDIGYNVNNTFGNATTTNGTINYGGIVCAGINVAGTNDGLLAGGLYNFMGNQSTNILISCATLLSNDTNATSLECLEDITTTPISLLAVGTSATNYNFNSAVAGLHLLRYIPKSAAGIRGNITYVYVYVNVPAFGSCVPTANACNLVMNGAFEQNSGIPTDGGQINRACGWNKVANGTPDYCYQNTIYPLLSVPSNAFGNEPDNVTGNKGYGGFYIYGSALYQNPDSNTFGEIISTRLSTPLAASSTYQISFDVSLGDIPQTSDGNIAFKQQMLLTNNPIPPNALWWLTPTQVSSGIFRTSPYFSTIKNGWDTVVFNITTTTGGQEYLYLGALNSVPKMIINPSLFGDRSYYYVDNVKIINTTGQGIIDLPAQVCQTIPNLAVFLNALPTTGVFAGLGVVASSTTPIVYSLNVAGLAGTKTTISYNYSIGGCNYTLYKNVEIIAILTPKFNQIAPICKNAVVPLLSTTCLNGLIGTWSPATINNQVTTTYTFTPNTSYCTDIFTMIIQVKQPNTPIFVFGNTVNITCGNIPILNNISANGVSGYWLPAVIAPNYPSTYTFINSCGPNFVLNTSLATFPYLATTDNIYAQYYTNATTLVTSPGNFVNVLKNDDTNTLSPNLYSGITVNLVGTMPTPLAGSITLNSNGTISLGANTTPGIYNFSYNFTNACTTSNTVTVTLKIKAMVIFTPGKNDLGQYCYLTTAYNTALSLLKGIKFNGFPANFLNSIIQILTPLPAGLTLNQPVGTINVAAGMQPGDYVFQFKVCSLINPTNCSDVTYAFLGIQSTITANYDGMIVRQDGSPTIAYPTAGAVNVLTNDIYGCDPNGIAATLPSVTLTETTNPVNQYYGINGLGNVFRKPPFTILNLGNPAFTLSYKICDPLFPLQNCSFANVFIEVRTNSSRGVNPSFNSKKDEYNLNKITVQPNPSSGLFNIRLNNKYNVVVLAVYNLIGQKIVEQSIINQLEYSLDLNNFSAGTYLMKIEIDNELFTEKLIKQ